MLISYSSQMGSDINFLDLGQHPAYEVINKANGVDSQTSPRYINFAAGERTRPYRSRLVDLIEDQLQVAKKPPSGHHVPVARALGYALGLAWHGRGLVQMNPSLLFRQDFLTLAYPLELYSSSLFL